MVRESDWNSWSVSGLPCRKYSSTGVLADMKLAIKRWIGIVSVSVIGSMTTAFLTNGGGRAFQEAVGRCVWSIHTHSLARWKVKSMQISGEVTK